MAKSQAVFIELNIRNKFRYACDIIEKFYDSGISVTVYTDDKKKGTTLDRQLWVWKQEAFIPHSFKEKISGEPEEPVIITTDSALPLVSVALILFDPLPDRSLEHYNYIIDFAEVYDQNRVTLSRERYKIMRESGLYEMSFFKLGEYLSKYKLS